MANENTVRVLDIDVAHDLDEDESEVIVLLGRLLGTGTFDHENEAEDELSFYDFVPADGVPLPAGYLTINLDSGEMRVDLRRQVKLFQDAVDMLKDLPRYVPVQNDNGN